MEEVIESGITPAESRNKSHTIQGELYNDLFVKRPHPPPEIMKPVHMSDCLSVCCSGVVRIRHDATLGCARFAKILQNLVAGQVFGRMCSIVFLANLLRLPIQTLLFLWPLHAHFSGVPPNFNKMSTPLLSQPLPRFSLPMSPP